MSYLFCLNLPVIRDGGNVRRRAGDVIPWRPLTSENSFELQIQAQRKHLPISYLTCNGQQVFFIRGGPENIKYHFWGREYNLTLLLRCSFSSIIFSLGLSSSFIF